MIEVAVVHTPLVVRSNIKTCEDEEKVEFSIILSNGIISRIYLTTKLKEVVAFIILNRVPIMQFLPLIKIISLYSVRRLDPGITHIKTVRLHCECVKVLTSWMTIHVQWSCDIELLYNASSPAPQTLKSMSIIFSSLPTYR